MFHRYLGLVLRLHICLGLDLVIQLVSATGVRNGVQTADSEGEFSVSVTDTGNGALELDSPPVNLPAVSKGSLN